MCMLFREPESTVTADDITEQAEEVCKKVRAMAAAAIRIAFKGETAEQFGGSRNAANNPRISADLEIDDLRSMIEEALSGQTRTTGYADAMSVQEAWTARLDRNVAARRAAALAKAVIPAPTHRPTSATRPSADAPFFGYASAAGA